ncbi:MAG TPA: hypothetical protein VK644_03350 [Chitinophagaceae bacterium]|nr:hypothetical protein [Chitinophagaceae bacterium]
MKQTNTTNSQKVTSRVTSSEEKFSPTIMADSLEVMEAYCRGRIASLEVSLNSLTIADNTKEIISLCQEIKKERKLLAQIIAKK